MTAPFVAELARRLQGRSAALALPLTWIEQRLAEFNLTIEQLVQVEAQSAGRGPGLGEQQHRQPADARRDGLARVRRDAVQVEQTLRHDPADVYRAHGLRHRATATVTRSSAWPRSAPLQPRPRWPAQRSSWPRDAAAQPDAAAPIELRMSATTWSTTARPQLERAVRECARTLCAARAPHRGAPPARGWYSRCDPRDSRCCWRWLLVMAPRGASTAPLAALPLGRVVVASPAPRCCLRRASSPWPSSTGSAPPAGARRGCCRAWTSRSGIPPHSRTLVVVPTMLSQRAGHRGRWSRRWRCASWPTATPTCTSAC